MLSDNPVQIVADMSANPFSPLALGYLLRWLWAGAKATPTVGDWLFAKVLTTDLSRRAAVAASAMLPGVILVLSQHMQWDDALRTSLLVFAVSQWQFLSDKKKGVSATGVTLIVMTLCACGVSKAQIEKGLDGGATVMAVGKPCLSAMLDAAEATCKTQEECATASATREAVADGYDAFGCLLCLVDKTAEGCATERPCERIAEAMK